MDHYQTRLKILTASEVEELFEVPKFTLEERSIYFHLNDVENQYVKELRTLESKVYFILQLGYFKSFNLFQNIKFCSAQKDINYILRYYFKGVELKRPNISKKARNDIRSKILELEKFRLFNHKHRKFLLEKALEVTRLKTDSKDIFEVLMEYLAKNKITVPGYSTFQKIISECIQQENNRLSTIIKKKAPQYLDKDLRKLLQKDDHLYGVTFLKKDAKGFDYREVQKEIQKKKASERLYNLSLKIVPSLKISEANISYYGSLVDYYSVDRLKELDLNSVRLYLLCYCFLRYEKIQDNLIYSFVYHLNKYRKQEIDARKEAVYAHKLEQNHNFKSVGKILDLFTDDTIPESTPFGDIKTKAFQIIPKDHLILFKKNIKGNVFDEEGFKWDYCGKLSR